MAPRIRYHQGLGSEKLPSSFRFGLSFKPLPGRGGLYMDADRVLESGYALHYSLGLEVKPVSIVAVRAGYGDFNFGQDGILCLGAGFDIKGVYFDYAYNGSFGRSLSGGHSLGIGYRLCRDE
jgi:hypothetical protein